MTSLRPLVARCAVLTLVLVLCGSLLGAAPAAAIDQRSNAQIRDRIEYLINRQRTRHGLRKLRVNEKTQYYARGHAKAMAARGSLFHDPLLAYEIPLGCWAWAENVALTSADNAARSAMRQFMHSSGHRANILSARMTHMGIGVARAGGRVYVVQRFVDRRG